MDLHQISSGVLKAEQINVFHGPDDHPSSSGPTQRKMAAIQMLKHGNLHTQHNELNKGSQLHSVTIRPLSEILKSEFV